MNEYKDKYTSRAEEEEAIAYNQEPDKYNMWNQKQSILNTIEDEFEHFINTSPINFPAGTTALNWWLNPSNHIHYPLLYRMAIDILSIPPMSSEPERIFSGAQRTITWQQMKLGPVNIERLECLKSWVRGGIVRGWMRELLVNVPGGGIEASRETSATSI